MSQSDEILTEKQAQMFIQLLERHYGQPVRPVDEYCNALETWMNCIKESNENKEDDEYVRGWYKQGEKYYHLLDEIEIDIKKSDLLDRLIYAREPLRTKKCPIHKGTWSGIHYEACPHGCNYTGWLPEE